MSLSLRAKQSLYHSLGQLVRSGVSLSMAVSSLANTSSGTQRRLLKKVNAAINAGKTLGEALATQRSSVSDLEIGVVTGGEKSGRLEHAMVHLAGYFGSLATAREGILKKCAYPLFVLHFGILLLDLPTLLVGGGLQAYLVQTGSILVLIWGAILAIALLIPLLRDAGSASSVLDALIRLIPLVGKTRRAFATARFCATYGLQLDAGINVLDALDSAQRASQSGLIRLAVRRVLPEVRNGQSAGPLLAASGAFPEPATRAIVVGEQTGQLDQELERVALDYQREALARIETATEWLPRLFHVGTLLYVGYIIVTTYQKGLNDAMKMLDSN